MKHRNIQSVHTVDKSSTKKSPTAEMGIESVISRSVANVIIIIIIIPVEPEGINRTYGLRITVSMCFVHILWCDPALY